MAHLGSEALLLLSLRRHGSPPSGFVVSVRVVMLAGVPAVVFIVVVFVVDPVAVAFAMAMFFRGASASAFVTARHRPHRRRL